MSLAHGTNSAQANGQAVHSVTSNVIAELNLGDGCHGHGVSTWPC